MASNGCDSTIKLPKELVDRTCGVAIDWGGSATKIIYRSREEYQGGKRICGTENEYGLLRTAMYPREDMDGALDFILKNCDLTEDDKGIKQIYSTGLGGNKYKQMIEDKLDGKLKDFPEFLCFNKALTSMVKTWPREEAYVAHSTRAMEMGRNMIEEFANFAGIDGMGERSEAEPLTDEYLKGISDGQTDFPCIMVMCGSAFVMFKVTEDGKQEFLDVTLMSGRYFLGSCAMMTGITDYSELSHMMDTYDGKTADIYTQDVTSAEKKDEYSKLHKKNMLLFPYGKCNSRPRDEIKDGDLVRSLAALLSMNLAQLVHLTATNHNIPRVLFCGSFVSNTFVRDTILSNIYFRNSEVPKEKRVRADFLNHGGFLGSIGAFLLDGQEIN